MEKIIKNCEGIKKCNDGVNRLEKIKDKTLEENEIYERKEY